MNMSLFTPPPPEYNKNIIPIMHCFDKNYVIPAAVAFKSLLEHANKNFYYRLYVLHTDISLEDRKRLKEIVCDFENASLDFIDMNGRFSDLFSKTGNKAHYSKEIYYKFLAPDIFTQYDRIIIADVDVVYLDDISRDFVEFQNDDKNYLAGGTVPECETTVKCKEMYLQNFSADEREALITGAGYWIFNLEKMRRDGCVQKFIEFAEKHAHRLLQPEQDCVNIVCYPYIKPLPYTAMIPTYLFDCLEKLPDTPEVVRALKKPVQLHYATGVKPWNTPDCTKADIWYSYLLKTPYFYPLMSCLGDNIFKKRKRKYTFMGVTILRIKQGEAKLFGIIPLHLKSCV